MDRMWLWCRVWTICIAVLCTLTVTSLHPAVWWTVALSWRSPVLDLAHSGFQTKRTPGPVSICNYMTADIRFVCIPDLWRSFEYIKADGEDCLDLVCFYEILQHYVNAVWIVSLVIVTNTVNNLCVLNTVRFNEHFIFFISSTMDGSGAAEAVYSR